ncbi:MAG: inositol-3-phosphate synthase [Acidobacteria bacterium]|nr:MAG: inositol-3-phosphate synthase [Acidobacteriota bacterium]
MKIAESKGRLGVLMPGMGAVATTFIAGVEAIRRQLALPIGSLTQMGTIRLGKRTEARRPRVRDFVPLAGLENLEFGGWDLFHDDAYEAAVKAGVLEARHLDPIQDFLKGIKPMPAVFEQRFVKNLKGENIKRGAYAALKSRVPYANGAPNLTVDTPALLELAGKLRVPVCGKDFKTGQTLLKTIIAPGLKARQLGLHGWFSTNILGNRDGEVLDDPESFRTKEESKLSVLEYILQPELYPELYKNFYHKVRINYYPPRGDNKEGWDNLDIFGWLGYPMQIKIDFLCRDSILAAPIVLDLVLFLDLAQRAPEMARRGIQEWLSFYFKSPMHAPGLYPEHDLFIQLMKLKNTLRHLRGEEMITHLGLEYYD